MDPIRNRIGLSATHGVNVSKKHNWVCSLCAQISPKSHECSALLLLKQTGVRWDYFEFPRERIY